MTADGHTKGAVARDLLLDLQKGSWKPEHKLKFIAPNGGEKVIQQCFVIIQVLPKLEPSDRETCLHASPSCGPSDLRIDGRPEAGNRAGCREILVELFARTKPEKIAEINYLLNKYEGSELRYVSRFIEANIENEADRPCIYCLRYKHHSNNCPIVRCDWTGTGPETPQAKAKPKCENKLRETKGSGFGQPPLIKPKLEEDGEEDGGERDALWKEAKKESIQKPPWLLAKTKSELEAEKLQRAQQQKRPATERPWLKAKTEGTVVEDLRPPGMPIFYQPKVKTEIKQEPAASKTKRNRPGKKSRDAYHEACTARELAAETGTPPWKKAA